MTRVRFLLEAEEELAAAAVFYDDTSPGLGGEFLAEIQRTCRLIASDPESGRELSAVIRRRLVRRFPYAVLYSRDGDNILVVAVAHQRRRPGYWQGRQAS